MNTNEPSELPETNLSAYFVSYLNFHYTPEYSHLLVAKPISVKRQLHENLDLV